jgi:protein transport protein SEC61 subunit gamma and related proteins
MYEPIEEDTTFKTKARRFIDQCIRVLKITKKPSGDEFKTIVKVTGLGIAAIGMMGFLLHVIWMLAFPL